MRRLRGNEAPKAEAEYVICCRIVYHHMRISLLVIGGVFMCEPLFVCRPLTARTEIISSCSAPRHVNAAMASRAPEREIAAFCAPEHACSSFRANVPPRRHRIDPSTRESEGAAPMEIIIARVVENKSASASWGDAAEPGIVWPLAASSSGEPRARRRLARAARYRARARRRSAVTGAAEIVTAARPETPRRWQWPSMASAGVKSTPGKAMSGAEGNLM